MPGQAKLSRKAQAAWRRAADELLIDAIFGPGLEALCTARTVPIRYAPPPEPA